MAMTWKRFLCFLFFVVFALAAYAQDKDSRIRIIMIGAHPDDCDQDGGGTAILFSKMGYAVKFVSVTNGKMVKLKREKVSVTLRSTLIWSNTKTPCAKRAMKILPCLQAHRMPTPVTSSCAT